MKHALSIVLILVASACVALAQNRDDAATLSEVLRIEESRFAAMTRGDLVELGKILADDLIYTHSSGRVEGKKEFLGSLESGTVKYVAIHSEEKKARVYGSVVLVNGRAKVTVNTSGQEQTFVLRYLDVYAKRDGKWQMVAWQSTRLP